MVKIAFTVISAGGAGARRRSQPIRSLIQVIAERPASLLDMAIGKFAAEISALPDYRLYLLNPHSGHIDGVEEFHSGDDVEAVCLVAQRQAAVPMELWSGGRKISRFDALPETAAAVRIPASSTAAEPV